MGGNRGAKTFAQDGNNQQTDQPSYWESDRQQKPKSYSYAVFNKLSENIYIYHVLTSLKMAIFAIPHETYLKLVLH